MPPKKGQKPKGAGGKVRKGVDSSSCSSCWFSSSIFWLCIIVTAWQTWGTPQAGGPFQRTGAQPERGREDPCRPTKRKHTLHMPLTSTYEYRNVGVVCVLLRNFVLLWLSHDSIQDSGAARSAPVDLSSRRIESRLEKLYEKLLGEGFKASQVCSSNHINSSNNNSTRSSRKTPILLNAPMLTKSYCRIMTHVVSSLSLSLITGRGSTSRLLLTGDQWNK